MLTGLDASAMALQALQTQYDITTQNLANVDTPGYRRQFATFSALLAAQTPAPATPVPALPNAPATRQWAPAMQSLSVGTTLDTGEGAAHQTGNRCDLALSGDGYFTVQAAGGEAYTRTGAFCLDGANQLTTLDGLPVLGEHGPITITSANWEVTPSGEVRVGGVTEDQLKLVTFPPASGQPLGKTLWRSATTTPATQVRVTQGTLESANVNTMSEMINLITMTRQFEANQHCVQALDGTLDHAVNDIARV